MKYTTGFISYPRVDHQLAQDRCYQMRKLMANLRLSDRAASGFTFDFREIYSPYYEREVWFADGTRLEKSNKLGSIPRGILSLSLFLLYLDR